MGASAWRPTTQDAEGGQRTPPGAQISPITGTGGSGLFGSDQAPGTRREATSRPTWEFANILRLDVEFDHFSVHLLRLDEQFESGTGQFKINHGFTYD